MKIPSSNPVFFPGRLIAFALTEAFGFGTANEVKANMRKFADEGRDGAARVFGILHTHRT